MNDEINVKFYRLILLAQFRIYWGVLVFGGLGVWGNLAVSFLITTNLFFMFTSKKDLVKQVNWALRAREPIGFRAVSDLSAKWKTAGCELRFDGSRCAI